MYLCMHEFEKKKSSNWKEIDWLLSKFYGWEKAQEKKKRTGPGKRLKPLFFFLKKKMEKILGLVQYEKKW